MDAIPAQLRKALYVTLFIAGVVIGALNVADVNTGKAVDVIAYLGTALGLVAAGNVSSKKTTGLPTYAEQLAHNAAQLEQAKETNRALSAVATKLEQNPKMTGKAVADALNGAAGKGKA